LSFVNHKSIKDMKRIIIPILTIFASIAVFAQAESQHLRFKGVPIDGTLNQFVSKMRTKGFVGTVNRDGTAALKGDFAGYKGCAIIVSTLQNKDLVSTIGVVFPECNTWETLERNYLQLKEMLTTKYGEPAKVVEKFQNSRSASDDSSKLYELKMDRCNYQTTFKTTKGDILLRLFKGDYGSCHVLLAYYDKINSLEVEAAALEDL